MIPLDVPKQYEIIRSQLGLPAHDVRSDNDALLLRMFIAGTIIATNHALLCIRERPVA